MSTTPKVQEHNESSGHIFVRFKSPELQEQNTTSRQTSNIMITDSNYHNMVILLKLVSQFNTIASLILNVPWYVHVSVVKYASLDFSSLYSRPTIPIKFSENHTQPIPESRYVHTLLYSHNASFGIPTGLAPSLSTTPLICPPYRYEYIQLHHLTKFYLDQVLTTCSKLMFEIIPRQLPYHLYLQWDAYSATSLVFNDNKSPGPDGYTAYFFKSC